MSCTITAPELRQRTNQINFKDHSPSKLTKNQPNLINIKSFYSSSDFNKILYNSYDGSLSLNDKKRLRVLYKITNSKTGKISASINQIKKYFQKNKVPSCRRTIINFFNRMERSTILLRKSSTTPERTREKKTNVYVFLKTHLFKKAAKGKIISVSDLLFEEKIERLSAPEIAPEIAPEGTDHNSLKLKEKTNTSIFKKKHYTSGTKNNSSRKNNVDFSILHSLKLLDEPKKFWKFYRVHNELVKNWLIKFPKLTLTKLANNLEYIFNELHFFREAGYIKKDPLGYLYKAMENHGGIIAGKQILRTKTTDKIEQTSTAKNKGKEKKTNDFSKIKSLKLNPNIEKYFIEAKINNYWLESHMKGLSLEHIKENLEYGYFQQCRKQKTFINNPAGYLLSSFRVYSDKRIPKPNDFKSEDYFEQEAKAQQEAKEKVAIETKNEEHRRIQLVVEKNKLNEKYLNKFQKIINNPNSEQLKQLIEAQSEYNQNRIKKTSTDGAILFLYKELLYHTFLKKQGIESKILNEISGVGIRLYTQPASQKEQEKSLYNIVDLKKGIMDV